MSQVIGQHPAVPHASTPWLSSPARANSTFLVTEKKSRRNFDEAAPGTGSQPRETLRQTKRETKARPQQSVSNRHPITEGALSKDSDYRQVFWLTDHPTNHAFSTVFVLLSRTRTDFLCATS